ncbi:hypothetical protein [Gaetbulibacter aestuarii]|uniref:Uncharacterized protein n=1 Tax=Gaetbulibacter aestuarii TaxID=1502358 RepID=A0ABW7MY28_9FLAO
MGGEGFMMHANKSLKENRSLLAKRKDKQNLQGSYAKVKLAKFPKATSEQLEKIRKRMQAENRRNKIILIISFALISIVVTSFIFLYLN